MPASNHLLGGRLLGNVTRREREVGRLVALGMTYKAIAKELGLAPRTVDAHRHRLYRRIGAHGIADVARWAIREGLVRV